MDETINKFLLAWDKFMPEMYLGIPTATGKPGFPHNVCEPFTKNKEKIQKFKQKGNSQ